MTLFSLRGHAPRICTVLSIALLLAACGGSEPSGPTATLATAGVPVAAPVERAASADLRTGPQAPGFPASASGLQGSPGLPQAADSGYTIDTTSREASRLFYKTVFASSNGVAAGWVGNVSTCTAGDTSDSFKAAALRRLNWFRAMAGVPANIQWDPVFNQKAQQAALLMSANAQLSHTPPTTWTCYNAVGAEAAGKSNLGLGTNGAGTVEGYVRDPGSNNAPVGHRRWVLYPQTQRMGIGDVAATTRANALWVQDANISAARPAVRDDYVAWPPRGFVPYNTVYPRWSLSYPKADFSGATVTMTENGAPLATRLEAVTNGFGENTLVWFPGSYTDGMGWAKPTGDTVYTVLVSNVLVGGQARSFSYTTTVFDPDVASDAAALSVSGSGQLNAGAPGNYVVAPWSGAQGYQWRALSVVPFALDDSADASETNFAATTSAGYSVVVSGIAATGANSFHLAHAEPVDQILQLRTTLAGRAASSLSFASRLGLATSTQRALVEASTDDGATWTVLYQQAGGTNEAGFTTRSVSLAGLAEKTFLLRFRYASTSSYYPQSTAGIGWYIDDVRLTDIDGLNAVAGPFDATATSFSFSDSSVGDRLLQARAQLYGYASGWGATRRVSIAAAGLDDCLFTWAERNYAQLFSPAATSQTSAPYYFRYYSGTQAYLGTSAADGNLYYLANGRLENVGAASAWYARAGCS